MLGTRGVRLGLIHPEIYETQARAIFRAARAVRERTGDMPRVEIMIPLVAYAARARAGARPRHARCRRGGLRAPSRLQRGHHDRAAAGLLRRRRDRTHAEFFSFGTNDLTQTALGFSRDDIESRVVPLYMREWDRRALPVRDDRRGRASARWCGWRSSVAAPRAAGSRWASAASMAATRSRSASATRPGLTTSAAPRSAFRSPGWRPRRPPPRTHPGPVRPATEPATGRARPAPPCAWSSPTRCRTRRPPSRRSRR